MNAPKFSFLVTGRNAGRFADECLDSVLSQTVPAWECLVVDDASTDDTPSRVDRYASLDSRFRVFHNATRLYQLANLLMLAKEAKGEVLINLSLDDWLTNEAVLEVLSEAYSTPGVDATYGSLTHYFMDEENTKFLHVQVEPPLDLHGNWWSTYESYRFQNLYTWRRALTLCALAETPDAFLDPETGSTYRTSSEGAIYCAALWYARKVKKIVEPLYCYRHHDQCDIPVLGGDEVIRTGKAIVAYWHKKAEEQHRDAWDAEIV